MFQYTELGNPNSVINFLTIPNIINVDNFRISSFEFILMVFVLILFIIFPLYQQWAHIRKNIRTVFSSPSKAVT